jgi:hypothetical protein
MAESLLDMEKLEHLINLEERLRLHPNLKAIYDTVMFELLDVNEACTKQVEARKKAEKEKAEAAAKLAAEKQAAAEADARARAQADADLRQKQMAQQNAYQPHQPQPQPLR